MISRTTTVRSSFALAATIAGGFALAAPAYAGACPVDKLRPDGSGEKMNATPAKDVGDTVLKSIDLANEPAVYRELWSWRERAVVAKIGAEQQSACGCPLSSYS